MTSSEFTEHLPGSNKVHYPISDRKDVTLVLTSVLGRQNHINVWCMIILIWGVFLEKFVLLISNLQESFADWFKLTNEILNIKGNIILCEAPVLQKLHVVDDNLVPRAYHLSDMGQAQGTKDTPSPPSNIRKERCPGYKVSFMTKY